MIHTCPKCGDYYADDMLAFCLTDGAPLLSVAPNSESWREGARIVEEKVSAQRKQQRRLKWRRFSLSAMTMLIVVMVVCVAAINGFIYLKPKPDEVVLVKPSTQATAPAEPGPSIAPNVPSEPVPTPTPRPTPAPSPTASPIAAIIPAPTPTPSPSSSPRPTPSPTPSPTPEPTPTPTPKPTPTPTPTPTPWPSPSPSPILTLSLTPRPTPTPVPKCSDEDKSRERETIIARFGAGWRRNIERERSKIIAQNAPEGLDNAVEASLGPIEYQITFFRECTGSLVTARYVWQIKPNLAMKEAVTVAKRKTFACMKIGGAWLCP